MAVPAEPRIQVSNLGQPKHCHLTQMKRTPQVRVIRRALGLSQEAFAMRFHIPLGTLRDSEQGRMDPDAAARAYLTVIGRNPNAVSEALEPAP